MALRFGKFCIGAIGMALVCQSAMAEEKPIKIGMLLDLSGVYADVGGKAHERIGHMIEEDAKQFTHRPVQVLVADFQQNAGVALTIARNWIDQDVNVIVDAPNSAIAIALGDLVTAKNKVYLAEAASVDLTGKYCKPNVVRFMYNNYPYATETVKRLAADGRKTFFLLNSDYALGHSFASDAANAVNASGGKVLGNVFHPLSQTDFAAPILQAQASQAEVLATGDAGEGLTDLVKQAGEFDYTRSHTILAMNLQIQQVPTIGLAALGGGYAADTWYWDQDEQSRAFAARWFKQSPYAPGDNDAAVYSMMAHYLRAVEALGSNEDGRAVVQKMKSMQVNDFYSHGGHIRPDGQLSVDVHLVQVKTAAESQSKWDVFKTIATIPGDKAFDSPQAKECNLNAR